MIQRVHATPVLKKQRRKQLTLLGELGTWSRYQVLGGVNLSGNLSTGIPEALADFDGKKRKAILTYMPIKFWRGKCCQLQNLCERNLHFLTQRRDINQLLAFPPPYLTVLSGTSPHLHQQ